MPITQKPLTTNRIGLPDRSFLAGSPSYIAGVDYEMQYETRGRYIRSSVVNITQFVQPSNGATLIGTILAGSTHFITNTLTFDPPFTLNPNFAIPYFNLYQGTSIDQSNQFYPGLGVNINYGSWSVQWGFDRFDFLNDIPGTKESVIQVQVHNNMNVTGTYFYASIYKYIWFNSGTTT